MVGQLFMTYVYGSSATDATTLQRMANLSLYGVPTGAEVIRRWHLGGIILLDHNTLDPNRPDLSTGYVNTAAQDHHLDSRASTSGAGRFRDTATHRHRSRRWQSSTDHRRRDPATRASANLPDRANSSYVAATSHWVDNCVRSESTRTLPRSPTWYGQPPE